MTPLEALHGERASPEQGIDLRHLVTQTYRLHRLSARRSDAMTLYSALDKKKQSAFVTAWRATERRVEDHLVRRAQSKSRPLKKEACLTSFMVAHSVARVRDTFYALMLQGRAPDQCSAYALEQWSIF